MTSRQDAVRDRIEETLTPPLLVLGLDVEAVEITPAGTRRVLRVAIDTDGGVTLDDVADAAREISRVLDDSDVMGELPYTLEVTSRGVDRPLTLPRHWRRNADRLVKVTFADDAEVPEITGRILSSTEDSVTLEVDGSTQEVALDTVTKALVQVEFNRRKKAEDPEDPEDPEDFKDTDDGDADVEED